LRKRKHEIGLPPDDLSFKGVKKIDKVQLRIFDFDPTNQEETKVESVGDVIKYAKKKSVTWFNIDGLHDEQVLRDIEAGFQIDKLILADVMNISSRPKVTEFSDGIFISLKMLQIDEDSELISVENLSLILTKSILISFQERKGDVFEPVRDRIRSQKKRIITSGTDYLLFALLDIVIDNYIYILSILGEKIELLEEKLIQESSPSTIDEINVYKKELNSIRRNIHPAKEMILNLSKIESDLISDDSSIHYKELLENIKLATEASDSYRDILSDQLNIYHTIISSKLNDIMKFLTVFSVIFIPLTFIAGIYGTNFDFLPELHFKFSYFIMLAVMLIIAVGMLIFFKKKKWL
jgi:magnesium transporter